MSSFEVLVNTTSAPPISCLAPNNIAPNTATTCSTLLSANVTIVVSLVTPHAVKPVAKCTISYVVSFPKHFTRATNGGKNWIVLCAGSNDWFNYADQAIVYRAYHLFRSYGIPEENIIIFHYDDIAYNKQNPTPGIVINEYNGTDVYKGVPKDYTGKDVNPTVLQGDQELAKRGKKVVNSGPNDHIFAYFGDHGFPGGVSFATGSLYATELNAALKRSMFYKLLPDNINNTGQSVYYVYNDSDN
ncbi:unnamed protein product [Oppiella nova]|uniref:Uncharacterized protein n=1 Tax=Oppiella nova TaxID=334625 RepID=A0A7R9M8G9_9ACAR|nr:unnamed protein product [Oppiella nova]CAG2172754.1 unnamed protein product [Oppiella nova]